MCLLPFALVALLALPAAASATFPGKNGKIAFSSATREGSGIIYLINPSGAGGRKVAVDGSGPAFSASGRTLLYYYFGRGLSGISAWSLGTAGSDASWLTDPSMARTELNPAADPSGTRFVFTTDRSELFVAGVPKSGTYSAPRSLGKRGACADWSPNGRSIAYLHRGRTRDTIRRVSPAGRTLRSIYRGGEDDPLGCPSWSPDGKLVAFSAEARGTRYRQGAVLIYSERGRLKRQLTHPTEGADEQVSVAFSPDGKFIVYGSSSQGLNVVRLSNNKRRRICGCRVFETSWGSIPAT